MEITLRVDNEEKTFIQPFVSARILRRTFEYDKKFQELLEAGAENFENYDRIKDLELAAEYVSEVFNNQFTAEQFLDGVESYKAVPEYTRIKRLVQTGREEAFGVTKTDNEEGKPDPNV
ncbi:phage tail assembly chaperone G [Candidatus Contubernalis alkaliaceticus]|uniref:phage tail assembly chaperone G n=1 Tax=Candidatus Contubernalis alkaliaceticus TaxID=338645 RepID=UPI001F4C4FD4|nr:hypothetical protein [Candidatus Contubernalis alkalaceticus]UNC91698.1 hypothetical protein HUE98_06085 [Candidatus Contubernalis alkalaceticus]